MTDEIIFAIIDKNLSKRLLSMEDLTCDKAITVAVQHENVERDSFLLSSKLRLSANVGTEVNVLA